MIEERKSPARLIIDPDRALLARLQAESKDPASTTRVSDNGKSAQLLLADTTQALLAIFVNPKLPGGYGLSVVRFAHRYRPGTPIYFLADEDKSKDPYTEDEIHRLGVQEYIRKPLSYAKIKEFPRTAGSQFDPKLAIDLAARNADALDTEVGVEDIAFIPIVAEHFLSGSISFFDIYVKLSSSKYIKILKAGDSFSHERISDYLTKGVTHFYLRKEAQEVYLNYCEKIAASIVKSGKFSHKLQVKFTLNHGQEVAKYLEHNGINRDYIQYASYYVGNVSELIKNTRPSHNIHLDQFLSDVAAFEHGVAVTLIAAMVARALGINSDKSIQTVGLAAMMHDCGLLQLPSEIRHEDESKMDDAQLRLYQTHPLLGAEICRTFKEVEPTVIQAIMQHHERRNKLGFPGRLGGTAINQVSEIVGVSDLLIQLVQRMKNGEPNLVPIQEVLKTVVVDFSHPIAEAFKSIFAPK